MARQGRPPGYKINPAAFRGFVGDFAQSTIADVAGKTPGFISALLSGSRGADAATAQQITDAVNVVLGRVEKNPIEVGALFPQLVEFRTEVAYFVAPLHDGVAA